MCVSVLCLKLRRNFSTKRWPVPVQAVGAFLWEELQGKIKLPHRLEDIAESRHGYNAHPRPGKVLSSGYVCLQRGRHHPPQGEYWGGHQEHCCCCWNTAPLLAQHWLHLYGSQFESDHDGQADTPSVQVHKGQHVWVWHLYWAARGVQVDTADVLPGDITTIIIIYVSLWVGP